MRWPSASFASEARSASPVGPRKLFDGSRALARLLGLEVDKVGSATRTGARDAYAGTHGAALEREADVAPAAASFGEGGRAAISNQGL